MIRLVLALAALLALPLHASPQNDAAHLVGQANKQQTEAEEEARTFVNPFDQTPNPYLDDAKTMAELGNTRMKNRKGEAQDMVNEAEAWVASQSAQYKDAIEGKETDGVDLDALLSDLKSPAMGKGEKASNPVPSLLVFVSLTMDKENLLETARQTFRAGGKLVLRGFVNDKLSDTITAIKSIREISKAKILIDPTLYRMFNVRDVPQIIVVDGKIKPCDSKKKTCTRPLPAHDRMRGNVSLYYALERMAMEGDASEKAMEHLSNLHSEYWQEMNQ